MNVEMDSMINGRKQYVRDVGYYQRRTLHPNSSTSNDNKMHCLDFYLLLGKHMTPYLMLHIARHVKYVIENYQN